MSKIELSKSVKLTKWKTRLLRMLQVVLKVLGMTANGKNDIKRFKLVVVGDGACGKTSLLTVLRYVVL